MTTVFEQTVDGPAVHVLIIGVGAYPNLSGGEHPASYDTWGLGQLSSPPASARHFLDWVVRAMNHPRARLGSVELLISQTSDHLDASIPSHVVESATMANVVDAFDRWFARCDEAPGNVALFYFCGHGLERESQYLLLEDFAASRHRLLENAVDIGRTYQGMADCRALEQYFFIDACREIPFQITQLNTADAKVLRQGQLGSDPRTDTVLLFATSGGTRAYAQKAQPPVFTSALVKSLDGLGAYPMGLEWGVDLAHLFSATTALVGQAGDGRQQRPTIRNAVGQGVLHRCPSPPVVSFTVTCVPTEAVAGGAQVALTDMWSPAATTAGGAPDMEHAPLRCDHWWEFKIPAATYQLSVDYTAGGFPTWSKPIMVVPPLPTAEVRL